jgi:AAA ATPase domain/Tetratricopeptide repeat
MDGERSLPYYVRRGEEQQIRDLATRVRDEGHSHAVIIYGSGGIGKTRLLRQLARTNTDPDILWLEPIDVDDPEYWLLSNLERKIAEQLDPADQHFGPYKARLAQFAQAARPEVGHETVVSQLARMKSVFVECYQRFVEREDPNDSKTVVITLDTVEAVRGLHDMLLTLTQLMKALPRTLFILACRPVPDESKDPILQELDDPHQGLPVTTIRLREFSRDAALEYLSKSAVAESLSADEREKFVHLTRGHPLWLALAVEYLAGVGMPAEAGGRLVDIQRDLPYQGEMTSEGKVLHDEFQRRLVTPYRATDFWHEATKRLAVARQSVDQSIWQQLMADLPLPDDVENWEEAWERLLNTDWIRLRANQHFVTLHDALAEELAQRVIPLHDLDGHWRHEQWRRAIDIYTELAEQREREVKARSRALDEALRSAHREEPTLEVEAQFIGGIERNTVRKDQLDQLKAARLYYQLLHEPAEGSRQFLELFKQARKDHDVLFQDLIALEMQRFLPGEPHAYALSDVIHKAIQDFQRWLSSHPDVHLEIGLTMADYLIRKEQSRAAFDLLDQFADRAANPDHRYRLSILRGNACMRIPGRVRDGEGYFLQALSEASALRSPGRERLIAKAYKELGFYYRNEGLWRKADKAYEDARDAIRPTLHPRSAGANPEELTRSKANREEMASIQSNWAYVKALRGRYREAQNLVESAISIRQRLGLRHEEGISHSVCGEVYRYDRQFRKAWEAYKEAQHIFHELRNWSWLGLIYQEQAICLFQAAQDGIDLEEKPYAEAKQRITLALDYCRDQAVRGYPSALNRAGRIFGRDDVDEGLKLLDLGIKEAHRLSDGWFWFANLIEYAELNYRAWSETQRREYRDRINARGPEIEQAMADYTFPDLEGRWHLLQGHFGIHDAVANADESRLPEALEHYKRGFEQIVEGYVGSHGMAAIPYEFKRFQDLFSRLSDETKAVWHDELSRHWSDLEHGSTILLARLGELD